MSKKAKLARQYYSTLAREQKPPLAREQKPPLAREQKPPLAREQKPPLALVVNKDNQSRTVSPFLLATAGADKHQPRYSLTSLKRKRAPARAPPAIEKAPVAKPIANPHAKHLADGNPLLSVLRTQPTTPRVPSQENLHRGLLSTSRETSHPRKRLLARGKNDSNSSCSIPRRQGDNHHTETCSPSPSRSRSSSPRSNNHRSTSPSNSSHASGS